MSLTGPSRRQLGWTAAPAVGLAALLSALLLSVSPGQQAPPPDTKAQSPEAAPPAGEKQDEEKKEADEPVYIEHADQMSYDPDKNLYFLTTLPADQSKGPIHFRHKDTHLYCDQAQYNRDEDTARATGNLKIVQPDTTITGDLITADFDNEVADIIGNVRLITQKKKKEPQAEGEGVPKAPAQPAPEGEEKPGRWDEFKEKLTTVTCDQIRYWYEEKHALATGNIVAEQEDKKVYADEAEYVEKDDLLTLKGNPVRLLKDNGDGLETPWAKVEVEGEHFWTGPFTGTFKREKKGEPEAEAPPAPQSAEPPKTP